MSRKWAYVMKWKNKIEFLYCVCGRSLHVSFNFSARFEWFLWSFFKGGNFLNRLKYACLCVVLHLIEWQVTLWQLCLVLVLHIYYYFLNSRCWTQFGTLSKLSRVLVQTSVTVSYRSDVYFTVCLVQENLWFNVCIYPHTVQFCSNVIWMKLHTWL